MIPFPIVDTHVHLYDTNRLSYPWLSMAPKIAKPYLPADFDRLRGGVEVDKIVFVEVAVDDAQQHDEAAFISELAARSRQLGEAESSAMIACNVLTAFGQSCLRRAVISSGSRLAASNIS